MNKHNGISYLDVGPKDALPVILIHGFPLTHKMWQPQIDVLQKDFRVIAYDIRGLGQSDVGDGHYTMETFSDDLIALMNHLNISQAVWCALSMGGYIALRAYERFAKRCQALVLCNTRSEADTKQGVINRAHMLADIKSQGLEIMDGHFISSILSKQGGAKDPQTVAAIQEMIHSCDPLGVCGTLMAIAMRTDATEDLKNITVPTAIIVGEDDVLTPVMMSQSMHERIKSSQLYTIPRAGHLSNFENPQEFNLRLCGFLKNLY